MGPAITLPSFYLEAFRTHPKSSHALFLRRRMDAGIIVHKEQKDMMKDTRKNKLAVYRQTNCWALPVSTKTMSKFGLHPTGAYDTTAGQNKIFIMIERGPRQAHKQVIQQWS